MMIFYFIWLFVLEIMLEELIFSTRQWLGTYCILQLLFFYGSFSAVITLLIKSIYVFSLRYWLFTPIHYRACDHKFNNILIMIIICSNIAHAFALVSAMSIVRFRNPIKETTDLIYIFSAIAIGMAVGTGFLYLAIAYLVIFVGYLFFL